MLEKVDFQKKVIKQNYRKPGPKDVFLTPSEKIASGYANSTTTTTTTTTAATATTTYNDNNGPS